MSKGPFLSQGVYLSVQDNFWPRFLVQKMICYRQEKFIVGIVPSNVNGVVMLIYPRRVEYTGQFAPQEVLVPAMDLLHQELSARKPHRLRYREVDDLIFPIIQLLTRVNALFAMDVHCAQEKVTVLYPLFDNSAGACVGTVGFELLSSGELIEASDDHEVLFVDAIGKTNLACVAARASAPLFLTTESFTGATLLQ